MFDPPPSARFFVVQGALFEQDISALEVLRTFEALLSKAFKRALRGVVMAFERPGFLCLGLLRNIEGILRAY